MFDIALVFICLKTALLHDYHVRIASIATNILTSAYVSKYVC
jgi:hypothetical protein